MEIFLSPTCDTSYMTQQMLTLSQPDMTRNKKKKRNSSVVAPYGGKCERNRHNWQFSANKGRHQKESSVGLVASPQTKPNEKKKRNNFGRNINCHWLKFEHTSVCVFARAKGRRKSLSEKRTHSSGGKCGASAKLKINVICGCDAPAGWFAGAAKVLREERRGGGMFGKSIFKKDLLFLEVQWNFDGTLPQCDWSLDYGWATNVYFIWGRLMNVVICCWVCRLF